MRRTLIAGNWKMHKTTSEASQFITEICGLLNPSSTTDILVCPPFTALAAAVAAAKETTIGVGAQNMFWKDKGAYTGQIAPSMLIDLGVKFVVLGHSEARGRFGVPEPDFDETVLRHFGDSDTTVNRKTLAALAAGLTPIVCVGETIDERRAGNTDSIVASQVRGALEGVTADQLSIVVMAYEPVWAIGTGEVCSAPEADRVCGVIRSEIASLFGETAGSAVRIQYGGSVKPDNAADLLSRENIDGALVGGASLKPADFAGIVNAAP